MSDAPNASEESLETRAHRVLAEKFPGAGVMFSAGQTPDKDEFVLTGLSNEHMKALLGALEAPAKVTESLPLPPATVAVGTTTTVTPAASAFAARQTRPEPPKNPALEAKNRLKRAFGERTTLVQYVAPTEAKDGKPATAGQYIVYTSVTSGAELDKNAADSITAKDRENALSDAKAKYIELLKKAPDQIAAKLKIKPKVLLAKKKEEVDALITQLAEPDVGPALSALIQERRHAMDLDKTINDELARKLAEVGIDGSKLPHEIIPNAQWVMPKEALMYFATKNRGIVRQIDRLVDSLDSAGAGKLKFSADFAADPATFDVIKDGNNIRFFNVKPELEPMTTLSAGSLKSQSVLPEGDSEAPKNVADADKAIAATRKAPLAKIVIPALLLSKETGVAPGSVG